MLRVRRARSVQVHRHLSYANVMATLAVFIALGGGAWAVTIGRNDVGSREIAKNAVGSSELKNNKATGRDVDESSLGEVPSAAAADEATHALSADTAADASSVGGKGASDLMTSSAFAEDSTGGVAIAQVGYTTVVSATITTTGERRIFASGSVELEGADGGEEGSCRIVIDGDNSTTYHSAPDDIGTGNAIVIAINFAVTRPPGTYTASLQCTATGTMEKDDAAISLYGFGI